MHVTYGTFFDTCAGELDAAVQGSADAPARAKQVLANTLDSLTALDTYVSGILLA